jgi:hypothetical protein
MKTEERERREGRDGERNRERGRGEESKVKPKLVF